jgi:hypothetical protein
MSLANLLNPISTSATDLLPNEYATDSESNAEDIPPYLPASPKNASGKRTNTAIDDASDDTDSSDGYFSSSSAELHRVIPDEPKEGTSKSAVHSRKRRQLAAQGKLEINHKSYDTFKKKILASDSKAEFDPGNISHVRHSKCGSWLKMKDPYDAGRWNEHIKKCTAKGGSQTLFAMGFKRGNVKQKTPEPLEYSPCPGITDADDPRVSQYLRRTSLKGGGGRALPVIAKALFRKLFSKLTKKADRKKVLDTQINEWTWRNDHGNLRVFSTSCKCNVVDSSPSRLRPCSECAFVLKSKLFRNCLQRPTPKDANFIYTNHRFRSDLLGKIYGHTVGVKSILEHPVSFFISLILCDSIPIFFFFLRPGSKAQPIHSFCRGCGQSKQKGTI